MNDIVFTELFSSPGTCLAYVGPGSGITMIWALLAVLGGILFMVLGLVLWPVRLLLRLIRRNKGKNASGSNKNLNMQDSKVTTDDK
jgi:hypothetical protein